MEEGCGVKIRRVRSCVRSDLIMFCWAGWWRFEARASDFHRSAGMAQKASGPEWAFNCWG